MKTKEIATGLIMTFSLYVALETYDLIEPKQYHVVEPNYSLVNTMLSPITMSGTASSNASLSLYNGGTITLNY